MTLKATTYADIYLLSVKGDETLNKSVDIHGLTTVEAKKYLEQIISSSPKGCEITVIHGYNGGQALQNLVRKELKHKRIKQRLLGLNNGETLLILD